VWPVLNFAICRDAAHRAGLSATADPCYKRTLGCNCIKVEDVQVCHTPHKIQTPTLPFLATFYHASSWQQLNHHNCQTTLLQKRMVLPVQRAHLVKCHWHLIILILFDHQISVSFLTPSLSLQSTLPYLPDLFPSPNLSPSLLLPLLSLPSSGGICSDPRQDAGKDQNVKVKKCLFVLR